MHHSWSLFSRCAQCWRIIGCATWCTQPACGLSTMLLTGWGREPSQAATCLLLAAEPILQEPLQVTDGLRTCLQLSSSGSGQRIALVGCVHVCGRAHSAGNVTRPINGTCACRLGPLGSLRLSARGGWRDDLRSVGRQGACAQAWFETLSVQPLSLLGFTPDEGILPEVRRAA